MMQQKEVLNAVNKRNVESLVMLDFQMKGSVVQFCQALRKIHCDDLPAPVNAYQVLVKG